MVEKEAHTTSEVEVDFNFDARLFATDEILTTTLKGIVETIRNESNGGGKKDDITATVMPLQFGN